MSQDDLGPIDYLVAEFPGGRLTSAAFTMLLDAVARGSVRVLDLEFIGKDPNGTVHIVDVNDLAHPEGVDLGTWQGAASGLLDASDLAEVGEAIAAGSVAAILIYENLWVVSLDDVLHAHGARLVADGRIPPDDVVAALDATELDATELAATELAATELAGTETS
ncbi:MAG TPA: DUF6325 family protein [Candidatus Limnocylindria bacterium]|nr:DUF6325 family protein [Candidatus Limnocylindria bacterium]